MPDTPYIPLGPRRPIRRALRAGDVMTMALPNGDTITLEFYKNSNQGSNLRVAITAPLSVRVDSSRDGDVEMDDSGGGRGGGGDREVEAELSRRREPVWGPGAAGLGLGVGSKVGGNGNGWQAS